jgi:hypothetical protein
MEMDLRISATRMRRSGELMRGPRRRSYRLACVVVRYRSSQLSLFPFRSPLRFPSFRRFWDPFSSMLRRRQHWLGGVLLGLGLLLATSLFLAFRERTRLLVSLGSLVGVAGDEFEADVASFAVMSAPNQDACFVETQLLDVQNDVVALGYLDAIVRRNEANFSYIPLRLSTRSQPCAERYCWKERRTLEAVARIWFPDHEVLNTPAPQWSDAAMQGLRREVVQLRRRVNPSNCLGSDHGVADRMEGSGL